MSNIFKRITSTVLAFVMAMSCVVINTSAETPETIYKFYANTDDATANGDSISNNAKTVFTNATTGTKAFTSGTYTVEGKDYKLEKACSQRSFTIVVPANVIDATLTIVAKSSDTSSRTMILKKGTVTINNEKTLLDAAAVSYTGLSTGTYTLTLNSTTYYSLLTLKVPQIYEVSGTVTDNTGAAVKCATVSVGDDYTAQTDSNGKYSVLVKPGSYSIKATALGCFNSEEESITADKDVTKNFTLDKKKRCNIQILW